MKKLFNKTLSIIVSLCLILTLTPSAALATGSGGGYQSMTNVGEDEPVWFDSYQTNNYGEDPTLHLKGSTTVNGLAVDMDLGFTDWAFDKNFDSVADAISQTTPTPNGSGTAPDANNPKPEDGPIWAEFNGGSGEFDITWTIYDAVFKDGEYVKEPHTYKDAIAGNTNPITGERYDAPFTTHADDRNVDKDDKLNYFYYSITDYDNLEDKHFYIYEIKLWDRDREKEFTAEIMVSTYEGYSHDRYYAWDDTHCATFVEGNVYKRIPDTVAMLVDDRLELTDPAYMEMITAAADQATPQNISVPQALYLSNLDGRPAGSAAYIMGLRVHLDMSQEELAQYQEGDVVTVYRYNPDKNRVDILQGRVVIAVDEKDQPLLKDGTVYDPTITPSPGTNIGDGNTTVDPDNTGSNTGDTNTSTGGGTTPVEPEAPDYMLSVEITVYGESANLGAFAIGYPTEGVYAIKSSAGEGGSISPIGTFPFTEECTPTYLIYPEEGYEIDNIVITQNGIQRTLASGSLVGNVLTIDNDYYGFVNNDYVTITVNFKEVTPQYPSYNVRVELTSDDPDATGYLNFSSAYNPDKNQVNMWDTSDAVTMSSEGGVLFEFSPGAGYKVDTLTANGVEYKIPGTSYYIPNLTSNMNVVVKYTKGWDINPVSRKMTVSVNNPDGVQTGHVFDANGNSTDENGDPLSETVLRVPFGDVATASSGPEEDYMLDYVTLYVGDSTEGTDITSRVIADEDPDDLVKSVYNAQVYNVITDIRVVYTYKHIDTRLTVTNANVDWGDVDPTGTFPMSNGDSLLIKMTPHNGYTLGSVLMDGVSISNYLTERDGGEYYTLKVVKSDTVDPSYGNNPDGTVDKVLYINEAKSEIVVSFNSEILNPSAYLNISTSVAGVGGGTITPTQSVEPGSSATVWMFPDKDYTVQSVTVDGTAISVNGPNPTGVTKVTADNTGCIVRVDFEDIQSDHNVVVRFTPGKSEASDWDKYLIKPYSSSGGFVSPSIDTWAYKGTEQTFRFFPMTGYALSEVFIDGSTTPVDKENDPAFHGSSYVFSNIEADHEIYASFAKVSELTNDDKTHNLVINAGEGGTASPVGTFIVGSGSCMSVAIMPDDGYVVDKVNIRNSATPAGSSGINVAATIENGMLTIYDIRDDTEVNISFKKGEDPNYPSTDPSNLIVLKAHNSKVDAGASLTPQTEGLTFFKEPGTNHASVDGNFTTMIYGDYTLEGIYVNGEPINYRDLGDGIYTFTVDKDKITQQVLIEVRTTTNTPSTPNVDLKKIYLTVEGEGSISPSGIGNVVNVENGKSQTFYFLPADNNHKLEAVYVNDHLVSVNKYSYTISSVVSNMYIKAVFTEGTPTPPVGNTYTVNIIPKSSSNDGNIHGQTTLTTATVTEGGSISATFIPDNGYEAYLVDDDTGEVLTGQTGQASQLSGNTFQLRNITKNRNFTLQFVPIKSASSYHVITASSSDNGRISPEGSITVVDGETFTFTLLPDSGYTYSDVWINGESHPEMVNKMTITLKNIKEDMDVWVSFDRGTPDFTPKTWELTAETTSGGIVSPTEVTAADGITVPFTFIAQKGYKLTKVEMDGVELPQNNYAGGVLRVSANGNHHIVGTFTKGGGIEDISTHYSIFADCSSGGTISPIGQVSVPYGGNMAFSLMPDHGWKVKSITVSQGNSRSVVDPFNGNSYTLFNVTADTVFYVTFAELDPGEIQYIPNTYDITATSSANGSISPSGVTKVSEGSSAYFTFVPREGYKLSYVIVDGLNIPASSITRGQYSFVNVKEKHTIHAVYIDEKLDVADFATINVSDPANGSITPSGNVLVEKGTDASFRIAPYFGYKLTGIVYNGRTLSATDYVDNSEFKWDGTTFTIKNVSQDCSLSATFEEVNTNIQEKTPEYTKVTMIGNGPGSGGSTSFGPGTTVIEALMPNENLDISFIPDEGNSIAKLKVTYSDGTVKEYTDAELEDIWEHGYVRFTPSQVNGEPGITIEVAFQEMTDEQKKKVEDGEITPAGFHLIQASWKGSGTVSPSGTIKVANGATARFSMIPQSGYELSSLMIDDVESLSQLESNSRSYTFVGNDSHTLVASFGVTTSTKVTYKVTAKVQDNKGGRVSPEETVVLSGESASVNFFPDTSGKGYKLVGFYQNGAYTKYTTPSYVISHVTEDIEIIAVFEELEDGEQTWTVEPITIIARAMGEDGAQAQGSVSPTSVEVPLGSTQRFSFNPNPGYEVDYIVYNNTIIRFTSSPTTYIATPVKLNSGDPNTLDVYFRSIDVQKAEVTVTANVRVSVSGGNSGGSGTVSPTSRTVPYGDPTSFFIFPDKGYTIEKVLLDGQIQPYSGVSNSNSTTTNFTHGWTYGVSATGEEAAELAGLYNGGAIASTALYRGDASLYATAGVPTYYSSYITTIPSVTRDCTLEVFFRSIDDTHFTYVDTKAHRLTITSEGGGTVSPLGSGLRAEGSVETITTNAFSGYYLESIIVTQYDENGNIVSEQDMTDRLNGKLFPYLMGEYDTDVHVKYSLIGTPSYVHVGIASATNTEGDDLTVNVSPQLVTPDGRPVDFVRGETYSFFFSTEETGPNGRPYVIESISYNGVPVPFIDGSNYVTLPLNASGSFDIVFRELREDEVMIEPDTFKVTAKVISGEGSVTPETQPVVPGNPASVAFEGDTDLWLVDKVIDYYAEEEDGEEIAHEISSNDYSNGVYTIPSVLTDHRIEVSFIEAVRIQVNWDHEQGFITPNTGYDEYLLVDKNTSQTFVVAPYVNYEVQKVTMDTDFYSDDMTGFLRQSKKTTQYLSNLTGADVILTEEGMGVAGLMAVPDPEEYATTQSGATRAANDGTGVDAIGAPFARAYEFSTYKLTEPMNYLNASFVTDRIEDKTFEIKASVIGDYGGTVEPTLAYVNGGGDYTFTFHPNSGCQVVGIRINGGQFIEYRGNTYTFHNVTSDMTLEVGFDSVTAPGSNRVLRTLRAIGDLTKTGDMNGPLISMLLTLAGIALLMAFIVFLRQRKRDDEEEEDDMPPTPPMSGPPPTRPSIHS